MTIIEIENNLNNLISNFNKETFIFDLLLAYGTPKSTIKRLVDSERMTRIVNFEEPKSILSYLERKLIKEERCTNNLKSLYAQNEKN